MTPQSEEKKKKRRKTLLPPKIVDEFVASVDNRIVNPSRKTGAELFNELKDIQVLKAQRYMPTIEQLEARLLYKAMELLEKPELEERGYHTIVSAYGTLMKHMIPSSGDIQITATQTVTNYMAMGSSDCASKALQAAEDLRQFREANSVKMAETLDAQIDEK
jgi:hypothetical protein